MPAKTSIEVAGKNQDCFHSQVFAVAAGGREAFGLRGLKPRCSPAASRPGVRNLFARTKAPLKPAQSKRFATDSATVHFENTPLCSSPMETSGFPAFVTAPRRLDSAHEVLSALAFDFVCAPLG